MVVECVLEARGMAGIIGNKASDSSIANSATHQVL